MVYFLFKGEVIHKGPLVRAATGDWILKTIIHGNHFISIALIHHGCPLSRKVVDGSCGPCRSHWSGEVVSLVPASDLSTGKYNLKITMFLILTPQLLVRTVGQLD